MFDQWNLPEAIKKISSKDVCHINVQLFFNQIFNKKLFVLWFLKEHF